MRRQKSSIPDDFNAFLGKLDAAFDDPNRKEKAIAELYRITQGRETADEFFAKFEIIRTKAGLDKTESIMVRRPSLKWNFHAGERTSMKVDLFRPARLFVFHFLLPSQALLFLESTH